MRALLFALLFAGAVTCYAHVPPAPGQPNPADYPPLTDRHADGGR